MHLQAEAGLHPTPYLLLQRPPRFLSLQLNNSEKVKGRLFQAKCPNPQSKLQNQNAKRKPLIRIRRQRERETYRSAANLEKEEERNNDEK